MASGCCHPAPQKVYIAGSQGAVTDLQRNPPVLHSGPGSLLCTYADPGLPAGLLRRNACFACKAPPLRQDVKMKDLITIRGFVATEVTSTTTARGTATASFRVGVTSRRFDEPTKAWVDAHTNWFTVKGYRQLAGTIGCSIRKGQPVIVVGKLRLSSWEKDGRVYHSTVIDADAVGHDLTFGSANFTRTSSRPALSLVEPPHTADVEPPAGMDEPQDGPEDHEDGQLEEEGHPAVIIEDNDGDLVSLDLETGELAEV